jgi:glutamine synthetase
MSKLKLEYIWLDGYAPEPNLRSKTKVVDREEFAEGLFLPDSLDPATLPEWSFDGSSTQQAEGKYSDCVLKPVKAIVDPQRHNAYLVLCEVYLPNGEPHPTNERATFDDDEEVWLGFEQEYVLVDPDTRRPLAFPHRGYPEPQGMYYCGVGHNVVVGRNVVEAHLNACLEAGLELTGINAEVMLGQWEFQVLGKGAKAAADDLWLARYLLLRNTEAAGIDLEFHPKPVKGDWNGSGLHCNFSNARMRDTGGEEYFATIFSVLGERHALHITNYGSANDQRLTGHHETSSIKDFSVGASDRGCSIRIPLATASCWQGYLEDRRPASNADPYKIAKVITEALREANSVCYTANK